MLLNNINKLKQRRKQLRNNSTVEERLLWSRIKNKQLNGFKFRRQHSIGFYILDFYCPEMKLCIELDGCQHNTADNLEYDYNRTNYLNSVGIEVLRFSNEQVNTMIEDVISIIFNKLNE